MKSQKVLSPNPKEDKGKKELIRKTTHLKTSRWKKKCLKKLVTFSKSLLNEYNSGKVDYLPVDESEILQSCRHLRY